MTAPEGRSDEPTKHRARRIAYRRPSQLSGGMWGCFECTHADVVKRKPLVCALDCVRATNKGDKSTKKSELGRESNWTRLPKKEEKRKKRENEREMGRDRKKEEEKRHADAEDAQAMASLLDNSRNRLLVTALV